MILKNAKKALLIHPVKMNKQASRILKNLIPHKVKPLTINEYSKTYITFYT